MAAPQRGRPPSRAEGDAASTPDVGPKDSVVRAISNQKQFTFKVEVDLMQLLLFVVALATRLFYLDQPNSIVFDEVHYGRFAAMYTKGVFFFDIHPPLGKLLLALAGYVGGFDGQYNFERIGSEYTPSVPVWHMRFVPALCGSLLVPLTYQLLKDLNHSAWTALLAACFLILDNAFLTQSRFMLMEAPLLFFMSLSLISYVRFKKSNKSHPFSILWWFWLTSLGVFMSLTISIKYVGSFSCLLILVLITKDFWQMLPDSSTSPRTLWQHFFSRLALLLGLPLAIYLSIFYIHLQLLPLAGPHDDIMSSAFQASLQGGLSSITKGQPLMIGYGSQITLRHTHSSKPCWLHSHAHVYPLRYPDERGSSHQQQVTCYSFKDVNNWWIIKDPKKKGLTVDDPVRPVQHGDIIQLVHGMTTRALNSHDVAAPISPQHQEVSCYIDYNISRPAQNLWKVDIVNRNSEGDQWKTIKSHVRLVHLNTSQALKISGRQLPEWGFYQFEVVTDKHQQHPATVWNVEEHRYTRSKDDEEREKELKTALPEAPSIELSFLSKFWELQMKMLFWHSDAEIEHRYSSTPLEWPTMDRNIAYWINFGTNSQIHLLGNLVLWITSCVAILAFAGLLIVYMLTRRRKYNLITPYVWEQFTCDAQLILLGYIFHYAPFFLTDATLFLHHYLPALFFGFILLAILIEHIYFLIWSSSVRTVYKMLVVVWITAVVNTFLTFLPISYGRHSLSPRMISHLQWKDSWSFVFPQR